MRCRIEVEMGSTGMTLVSPAAGVIPCLFKVYSALGAYLAHARSELSPAVTR